IRVLYVTGVQTCALPISELAEIIGDLAGEQPARQFISDGRRNLEAMSAAAGEVRIARDLRTWSDDRVPVRRHVIERRIGFQQFQIGRASCRERVNVSEGA